MMLQSLENAFDIATLRHPNLARSVRFIFVDEEANDWHDLRDESLSTVCS